MAADPGPSSTPIVINPVVTTNVGATILGVQAAATFQDPNWMPDPFADDKKTVLNYGNKPDWWVDPFPEKTTTPDIKIENDPERNEIGKIFGDNKTNSGTRNIPPGKVYTYTVVTDASTGAKIWNSNTDGPYIPPAATGSATNNPGSGSNNNTSQPDNTVTSNSVTSAPTSPTDTGSAGSGNTGVDKDTGTDNTTTLDKNTPSDIQNGIRKHKRGSRHWWQWWRKYRDWLARYQKEHSHDKDHNNDGKDRHNSQDKK